ncbi:hypothetical protein C8Q76DRAFT_77097 [Earliella scabrosa]|nr:hypothetical protein C8Q76DRAFT_77097 [Earliella scabrosa]
MIMETAHAVMTMHTCYYYLVTNYFYPVALLSGIWSLIYAPIFISLITFISQLFFARRVFLIGPKYRLVVAISMLFYLVEIGVSVAAIYAGATIKTINDLANVTHRVAASFAAAIVGDAFLTGALFHVVMHSRRGLKRPESIIELGSIYIINTGLLHGILNVLALVLALALPTYLLHSGVNVVTTRLYANTLLAVLNSRQLNMSNGVTYEGSTFGMNIIARVNRLAAQERWNVPQIDDPSQPPMIKVKVTTEMEGEGDQGAKIGLSSETSKDIEHTL